MSSSARVEAAAKAGTPLRVLVIEDDESGAALLLDELRRGGYAPSTRRADSPGTLMNALKEPWDVVLSDYGVRRLDGLAALALVREHLADVPFLFVAKSIGETAAAAAIKAGAQDFVRKDRLSRLVPIVERELREAEARRRRRDSEAASRQEDEITASLARVGRELMSSVELSSLTRRSTRVMREALAADACWTLLRDAERHAFVSHAADRAPDTAAAADPCIAEEVVARWFPGRSDGEPLELRHGGAPGESFLREQQMQSALVVPLCRGHEVSGLQIAARLTDTGFDPLQRRIGRDIGRLASLSIENARLIAELDRANQLRSEFVATMSHELRTPLNVIIGYNDLLLEGEFGGLSREQTDVIRRSDRSAHELLDLINATLDLSRLDAGRLPLDAQTIDFAALTERLRVELERLPQRKPAVEIEWCIAPGLTSIRSDPVKIRVVLKNLIGNALSFTERGRVAVRIEPTPQGVEISVADTGVGIAPEELNGIFDPLQQVRRPGGLGLGLYIVRRLLDALGGSVEVESRLGSGSTFRVRLPALPPEPEPVGG